MKRILLAVAIGVAAAVATALALPAAIANATTAGCATIHDTITKTDTGHGSPAAWADLVLHRLTRVCGDEQAGYTVTLTDSGTLWTRVGAGTPNGSGGTIGHRVRGRVHGAYSLTVSGGKLARRHGDTSLSSTEYVRSLFSAGAQVTGGDYTWTYTTVCGETWVDSSTNNDGEGAAAGNITGKRCQRTKPSPTPTGSPTGTPTRSPSPTASPTNAAPSAPGEAPAPTPVRTDLPVTG